MDKQRSYGQRVLLTGVLAVPPLLVAVMVFETTNTGLEGAADGFNVGRWFEGLFAALLLYLISLGVLLYWLRENKRLIYGLAETIFAVLFMVYNILDVAFDERLFQQAAPFVKTMSIFGAFAKVAAAFYVFVRGMDNIREGLKPHPQLARAWQFMSLKVVECEQKKNLYPWQNAKAKLPHQPSIADGPSN
ncbi:hypothetical protein [Rhizobium leguminosarum]|uniref:hypothetical protein n=1 Tax=Rhizobium leguminosarum TaxID=384 RepID=UPI003F95ED79